MPCRYETCSDRCAGVCYPHESQKPVICVACAPTPYIGPVSPDPDCGLCLGLGIMVPKREVLYILSRRRAGDNDSRLREIVEDALMD